MDPEPSQSLSDSIELNLTNRVINEVSNGRQYNIDLKTLDDTSLVELRRLLRDLTYRRTRLIELKETTQLFR